MSFPQLKIRTEFTFRKAFGPIDRVAEALAEIGTPAAGIVDPNTWGHVRWEKALKERGIQPMFGTEISVESEDGRRPTAWLLAEDLKRFYNFTSAGLYTQEALAGSSGIIRFAGNALDDPATFDYIDINPSSLFSIRRAMDLHRHTKKPLVLTSDNWYPAASDRHTFLSLTDNAKMTPQTILTEDDLMAAFPSLDASIVRKAVDGAWEVAERLKGIELQKAPMIHFEGDLHALVEAGKKYRIEAGHIPNWTDEYEERLRTELEIIAEKEFESYFLVVSDLVQWAKQHMLVGPGRGSSAGSLVCYCLRITEVDPLVHQLLFARFVDPNRMDLPDIDIDFSDQRREMVFTYLEEKYGKENVARLGNISRLKPRSVMAECGKRLGIPAYETFAVRNVLIEYSSGDARYGKGLEDTLENTQPGRDFMEKFPEARAMLEAENHAWHTSVHAAGVLVSNQPVVDYCTVRDGIAQIDKPDSEYLNLLKIDALGLRTLGVIEDAGCVDSETLYGLTLDDPKVFQVFNDERYAGLFQFEGAAQRRVAKQIPVTSFEQIDHTTALARPGPLGGGATNTYIKRNDGREPTTFRHPSMKDYLGDTKGVVLYQEQVMRIVRELGKFSWGETSTIRKAMSGRKGIEHFNKQLEQFIAGAKDLGIGEQDAMDVWNEICSFGAWGMNKSHTVSYSIISYWCAYMKAYYPVEYAAALLRNAKDDEQVIETLRELDKEGVGYIPFDKDRSQSHWSVQDGVIIGGLQNIKGIGPAKAKQIIDRRAANRLTDNDIKLLTEGEVKYTHLRPAHALWGDYYANPAKYSIRGQIKEFAELSDREDAVVIARMIRKERRDENEQVRLSRRNGRVYTGQPLFLDTFMVDDSITKPVLVRIKHRHWFQWGIPIADKAIDKEEWFLIRGEWLDQFSMLNVTKIKCLTNPELFNEKA